MSHILSGFDGVICLMDDVLVFGSNKREHDSRLMRWLERIRTAGVTLNKDKCEFGKDKISFLGHTIDGEGIHADPEKTDAIRRMELPTSITELRFMGMVNQLGKFSAKLWSWGEAQEQAFFAVKEGLLKPSSLAHYNSKAETKVSADASMLGLGAVLLQKHDEVWKPVAFASRSLSDVETRNAQIEKKLWLQHGLVKNSLNDTQQQEFEELIMADMQSLQVSSSKLEHIRKEQHTNSICSTVVNYCQNRWPLNDKVESTIVPYWNKQGELSVCDGILLLGKRIFIPKSLHRKALEKIYEGH
uniref:Reverse transcriptase domain-containing protein n=1 Tax=Amphimedon queenslandica TaxID=400682 RepID=A0A1X7VTN9_AMPQE